MNWGVMENNIVIKKNDQLIGDEKNFFVKCMYMCILLFLEKPLNHYLQQKEIVKHENLSEFNVNSTQQLKSFR